jgi:ribonuclease HII
VHNRTIEGVLLCGVDEVGRGSAVGDVFAAACILPADHGLKLKDSKKLTIRQREKLALQIRRQAIAWAIGRASCVEINHINIHRASLLAMERAVLKLAVQPDRIIVDGKFPLSLALPCCSLIGADDTVPVVSAASILAKVARDAYMDGLHRQYPDYAFDKNRGYLTLTHKEALVRYGPCAEHRIHYRPVRAVIEAQVGSEEPNLFNSTESPGGGG